MIQLPAIYKELTGHQRYIVRSMYAVRQGGKCCYCGGDLEESPPEVITCKKIDWGLFPEGFLKYPIHLHHDHGTGLTIGVVHAYCNAVMWVYEGK